MRVSRWSGAVLIATPVVSMGLFGLLQKTFGYPAIMQKPTAEILQAFANGGAVLVGGWYGMVVITMLFVPLVLLLSEALVDREEFSGRLTRTVGILSAAVQILALSRWVFLVPRLARAYVTAADEAGRQAASFAFDGFQAYLGNGLGEHLTYLLTALWTVLVYRAMRRSPLFRPWLAGLGVVSAVCIALGVLDQVGVAAAIPINGTGYMLWQIWLVIAGMLMIRGPRVTDIAAAK